MMLASFNGATIRLQVQWSDQVPSFVQNWKNGLSAQKEGEDVNHWQKAATTVLHALDQGPEQAAQALAHIYEVTGQLPVTGDRIRVEPLELQVEQRHFVPRMVGGVPQVEVHYYLGVEKYRYAELKSLQLSIN